MFNVVLVEPEIPPNTGNVIRLCANTGAQLHLIEPLGFPLDDAKMRRAGLDYHEYAQMHVHANWEAFSRRIAGSGAHVRLHHARLRRLPRCTLPAGRLVRVRRGNARPVRCACSNSFPRNSACACRCAPGNRSLNLSNTVAVVVFEAWRQAGFEGGA